MPIDSIRHGALSRIAREWAENLGQEEIPPKLATLAATFGAVPSVEAGIPQLEKLAKAGRELFSRMKARPSQPQLVSAIVNVLGAGGGGSANEIAEALGALATTELDDGQMTQLMTARPPLEELPTTDVVRILDAAEAIDQALSEAWSAQSRNNRQLVDHLVAETPFALPATFDNQGDGLVVHSDIFEGALEADENPNDRLFNHAKALLRLVPSAGIAHVRLVDATGAKTLHLDAEKRIPRENAPPDALTSANRHVLDAVAREVGGESWSAYLSRGEALATRGLAAFKRLLDGVMVGRVDEGSVDELNTVVSECDNLIPPFETNDGAAAQHSGQHLTPFQDVIFKTNAPLIATIAKLPEDAPRIAAQMRGLIDNVDKAEKEPWHLVRDSVPTVLSELRNLLNEIEIVALEAAASGRSPQSRWPKTNGKARKAFSIVADGSRRAFVKRLETSRREIEATVRKVLSEAEVIGPRARDGNLWQSRFIATFQVSSLDALRDWAGEARDIGERISSEVADTIDIALVPVIHSKAAIDLTFQLSRIGSHSPVADMLQSMGRSNLLARPEPEIVNRLTIPIAEIPDDLDCLLIAFRDIAGMSAFELGLPDRPEIEQQKLHDALATVETTGPALVSHFAEINHPTFEKLRVALHAIIGEADLEADPAPIEKAEWHDLQIEILWNAALEE